jgi:hypothetical protein
MDKKQKLFEMMQKVNSDFKPLLSEQIAAGTTGNQPIPTDVAHQQTALKNSPTMEYTNSRIDTPQEFQEGFKVWFSSTGFNPQKKPLNISQAQVLVKNAMVALGYK